MNEIVLLVFSGRSRRELLAHIMTTQTVRVDLETLATHLPSESYLRLPVDASSIPWLCDLASVLYLASWLPTQTAVSGAKFRECAQRILDALQRLDGRRRVINATGKVVIRRS